MNQLDDLVNGSSDFRRDRWDRPLIMQLDGTRTPYTRASSATKAIDDTWNLDQWDRRNVAYGMTCDASLVARVLAIGGDPSTWGKAEKDAIAKVVDDARTVAKAHRGADIGTAVHRIIERRNRGETISAGPYQADVDAYYRALDAAGIIIDPDHLECRLVCDDLELAGSADNIVGYEGRFRIADLKTGATVSYGVLGFAGQLAAYANGQLYDVNEECRLPTPELDRELGFIIHLPAGEGRCDIYEVDLARGYQAAKVAYQARKAQKAAKKWLVFHNGYDALGATDADIKEATSTFTTATTPVTSTSGTSPTETTTSLAPSAKQPSTVSSTASVPAPSLPPSVVTGGGSTPTRADLVARARALVDAGHGFRLAIVWPEDVPGFKTDHAHTDDELARIAAAISAIEMEQGFTEADMTRETPAKHLTPATSNPPITVTNVVAWQPLQPELVEDGYVVADIDACPHGWGSHEACRVCEGESLDIDEGPDITDGAYDLLKVSVAALPPAEQFRIETWVAEANNYGTPFTLRDRRTERRSAIAWALVQCSENGLTDEAIRACINGITGYDCPTTTPLGAIIGALTIAEAKALTEMAELRPTITTKGT
jgi:hypothetical protein